MRQVLFCGGPLHGQWKELQDTEYTVRVAKEPPPLRLYNLDCQDYDPPYMNMLEFHEYFPHNFVVIDGKTLEVMLEYDVYYSGKRNEVIASAILQRDVYDKLWK